MAAEHLLAFCTGARRRIRTMRSYLALARLARWPELADRRLGGKHPARIAAFHSVRHTRCRARRVMAIDSGDAYVHNGGALQTSFDRVPRRHPCSAGADSIGRAQGATLACRANPEVGLS